MKYRAFLASLGMALLASAALTDVALADESQSRSQAAQREARALMGRGLEARAAGDDELARGLYLESFAKHPSFDVACNLGRVESDLGRFVDAANHFVYCLKHFPTGESLAMKQDALDGLEHARQYATELTIEVSEPGVLITLDREKVGESPLSDGVFVAPGEHEIRGQKGGREVTERVVFGLGKAERVRLLLPPEAAAALPSDGQREPVNPGLRLATSLSLLGVGVAGIGVGVGFYVHSEEQRSEATAIRDEIANDGSGPSPCPGHVECEHLAEVVARSEDALNVAIGGFVGGGVFVGAAVLTYLLWPHHSAKAARVGGVHGRPAIAVVPARGGALFSVSGHF